MASAVVGVGPAPPAANRGSDPWRPPDGFVGEPARSAAVPAYAGKWLTLRFAGASGWGSGPRYGSGGPCGHVSVRTLARLVRIAVPG